MAEDSVGVVLPAYRPDPHRLRSYVEGIRDVVDPEVIRVELDDPDTEVLSSVTDADADINVSPGRRGKGAAVTAGFDALETDVLVVADSDGSVAPDSVAAVIDPICDAGIDLAVGSRRHPAANQVSHESTVRRLMGDVFAWTARRVMRPSLYDYQCGAKAIREDLWSRVRRYVQDPGYAWDVELIGAAAMDNAEIAEVPVAWEDREGSTVAPLPTAISLLASIFRVAAAQRRGTARLRGE